MSRVSGPRFSLPPSVSDLGFLNRYGAVERKQEQRGQVVCPFKDGGRDGRREKSGLNDRAQIQQSMNEGRPTDASFVLVLSRNRTSGGKSPFSYRPLPPVESFDV